MERVKGIEPSSQAWEARILPLNHTRAATDTIPTRELSRPQGRNCCPSVLQPKKSNLKREIPETRKSRMKSDTTGLTDGKRKKGHKPIGEAHPADSCGSCGALDKFLRCRINAALQSSPERRIYAAGRLPRRNLSRPAALVPVSIWLFTLRRFGLSIGP